MKLQLALDPLSAKDAIEVVNKVEFYIDNIEVSTIFLRREAPGILNTLRKTYPDHQIVVKLSATDIDQYEIDRYFGDGANTVIVPAMSADHEIADTVRSAHYHGATVLADLGSAPDQLHRARQVKQLGVDYIGIHAGTLQPAHEALDSHTLLDELEAYSGCIAVTTGVNADTIDAVITHKPEIITVGSAITTARCPGTVASQLQYKLRLSSYQPRLHIHHSAAGVLN